MLTENELKESVEEKTIYREKLIELFKGRTAGITGELLMSV